MDYVIGILNERLTRLESAWTEFVTSGKVSETSPTAKQKASEINELRTAIKILTTAADTGKNTCNIQVVVGRSEQFTCPRCGSIDCLLPDKENDAQCNDCGFIWAG